MAVIKNIDEVDSHGELRKETQQHSDDESRQETQQHSVDESWKETRLSTITGNGPSSLLANYEATLRTILEHVVQGILKQQEQLVTANPTSPDVFLFFKVSNTLKAMDRDIKEKYCILKEVLQENSNDAGVHKVSDILKAILEMNRVMKAEYCILKGMLEGNQNKSTVVNEVSDILKAILEMDRDMKAQFCILKDMLEKNPNQNASVHKDREVNQYYCILNEMIDPDINVVLSKIAGDVTNIAVSIRDILTIIKLQQEKTDLCSFFCTVTCICVSVLAALLSWSGPDTQSVTSQAIECVILCCVIITFFISLTGLFLYSTKTTEIFGRKFNSEVLYRFLGIILAFHVGYYLLQ
ncbi:hypothetical protein GQ457_16G028240 [Hibiscus cannabinus]